jgi:hypothetical protein
MAQHYPQLQPKHIEFIHQQHLFFIASSSGHEVNLSPKGLDSIRLLAPDQILYLDLPGSGNRTSRDIAQQGQITLMWTSFDGPPHILRAFCQGQLIEKNHPQWPQYYPLFGQWPHDQIRQLINFQILAIESSCGYGVPIMEFKQPRTQLTQWLARKSATNQLQHYIDTHAQPPTIQAMQQGQTLQD